MENYLNQMAGDIWYPLFYFKEDKKVDIEVYNKSGFSVDIFDLNTYSSNFKSALLSFYIHFVFGNCETYLQPSFTIIFNKKWEVIFTTNGSTKFNLYSKEVEYLGVGIGKIEFTPKLIEEKNRSILLKEVFELALDLQEKLNKYNN